MRNFHLYFVALSLFMFTFISISHELQEAQTQVLFQIRKYLEYPTSLEIWGNYDNDLCNLPSSSHTSIKCDGNSVTELKIVGDKPNVRVDKNNINGFAVSNLTLSPKFSVHSFVTTLTRLTSLRVLSLVSLGIWGPLPNKIHRLSNLQVLDLSSNFLFGSVPSRMATMVNLHTLALNGNYFNDTIPNWFDSLSNLNVLSLKNNQLIGSFPSSICKIKSLNDISLSQNELSGELPDLSALTSLHVLDLRENHLDSKLPLMPKTVVTVLLSKNSFSGEIPSEFGELERLQHLDLSSNDLSKTPPNTLFSLPNISYLNLASNALSGSLPNKLRCGNKLGFVDISNNKLNGALPSCLAGTSDRRVVRYGGNCLSADSQPQQRGSYCNSGLKKFSAWEIAVVVGIIFVVVPVILASGVLLYRQGYLRETYENEVFPKVVQDSSTTGVSSEFLASARFISQTLKLGTQATSFYRQFSTEELKDVTKNFDLSTYIGEGSIGKLYKAKLENGSYTVIRSVALSKKCSIQNLKIRLDLLSKLQHPNLVSLLGHSIDGGGQDDSSIPKLYLVYEYVPNGDYRSRLSEFSPEKALKWSDRLAILIGVAKAVHHLHTSVIPGCFGNNLKTNNILLDEHDIPKLSDYGMSIIAEEIAKTEAKEDNPELDDDVYNFGFILFESLVGPVASGKGEAFFLNEKASFDSHDGRRRIVDPTVLTTCNQESLSIAISITSKCISAESSSRPSFEDVLWNLQYAAQVQATAEAEQ
ncbi:hypothetical protein HN51_041502 [Arachis hypogaea]|uniref:Protein kinase domain-containing protein n=1 Tax=Arachis hypogaea TaxID=3818 RepID=A0A444YSW2_ARAHY|nr:probable inactive leucine-rich repeat receptor-like protein kinase At3g03770 [Arachis ipaensis]XP_025658817.1 probable inactive leucine-rich repeat receptor-like protein kinase At3g03770 [Arachis hypogaea]QHN87264.1 putative inactive leucine-rich repeat receptor-like protein kinase [Arachis hypogaea]RYR05004.1 hypothetical protein Ahy_B06g084830 [Arachis hypogaea]